MATRLLKEWINSQFARGLMLYLVLPNLAFFLLSREFFINRALINSDFLLLWVGSCYLRRKTTVVLYAGLVALDLILSTESIYHLSTVATIIATREILESDPVRFYSIAGLIFLLGMAAFVMTHKGSSVRSHLTRRDQFFIGIAGLVLTGVTVARSVDPIDVFADTFGDGAIVASSIAEITLSSLRLAMDSKQNQITFPAPGAATSRVAREISIRGKSAAPYNIVVILVESQGLLNNEGDMRRVLAPLIDPAIQERYLVARGEVHFYGSTMFAEMRTLCRIYMPYAIPTKLPGLERCLPNMLRRLGYETVSFHGYHRWFYQRELWYPTVGFQRIYFADEMQQFSPPKCGTLFAGTCDLWIADRVEQELLMPGKKRKFIYWLTLNSHLPVDSVLASESNFDCAGTETLREDVGPCELAQIHFRLYTRIAQIMLNEKLPPTRFIIVGDHVPPFVTLSARALYDNGRVPYVDLTPRGTLQARIPAIDLVGPR